MNTSLPTTVDFFSLFEHYRATSSTFGYPEQIIPKHYGDRRDPTFVPTCLTTPSFKRQRVAAEVEQVIVQRLSKRRVSWWRQLAAVSAIALASMANVNAADLSWNVTNGIWDINTTANWLTGATASSFNNGDSVTFTTQHAGSVSVVTGGVQPTAITIDSNGNYTFTGGPVIASGALTKSGSGSLTFNNSDTSFARLVIDAGQVTIANTSNIGGLELHGDMTLGINIKSNVKNTYLPTGDIKGLREEIVALNISGGIPTLSLGSDLNVNVTTQGYWGSSDQSSINMSAGKTLTLTGDSLVTGVGAFKLNPDPNAEPKKGGGGLFLTADTGGGYQFLNFKGGSNNGGAIHAEGSVLYVENALFRGNSASYGGAIWTDAPGLSDMNTALLNSDFVDNTATDTGGAIYFHYFNAMFNDVSFYRNTAGSVAGAVAVNGGLLTQRVSAGKISYYAGNTATDDSGNNYSDSLTFWTGPSYTVITDAASGNLAAGVLRMLDPMHVNGTEPNISKSGGGVWQLAGLSDLEESRFDVKEGTLELLRGGSETIALPGGGSFDHNYASGALKGDVDLTIYAGATLQIDGGNTMTSGTLSALGTVAFAPAGWQTESSAGSRLNPMLTLTNLTSISNAIGTGGIKIVDLAHVRDGLYTLVSSTLNNSVTDIAKVGGDVFASEIVNSQTYRGALVGTHLLSFTSDNNKTWLQLRVREVGPLLWNGASGDTWDVSTSTPWRNPNISSNPLPFENGASVAFNPDHAGTVNVAASGVNPMDIQVTTAAGSDYSFAGGAITANTLTKSGTGTLTLANSNNLFDSIALNGGVLAVGNNMTTPVVSFTGALANTSALTTAMETATSTFTTANMVALASAITGARDKGDLPTLAITQSVNLANNSTYHDYWATVASGNVGSIHVANGAGFTLDDANNGTHALHVAGGGLYLTAEGTGNYVFQNIANPTNPGGAIYTEGASYLYIENALFKNNSSAQGGAVNIGGNGRNSTQARTVITNSNFVGNESKGISSDLKGTAGGLYLHGGVLVLDDVSFFNNTAGDSGGAIGSEGGTIIQHVSAGKTSYYAGNTYQANGQQLKNSLVTWTSGTTYNVITDMGVDANGNPSPGILRMLDPIQIVYSSLDITKSGGGVWQLGHINHIWTGAGGGSKTQKFIVAEGTVELLRAGNETIELPGGGTLDYAYDAGGLEFRRDATGSFILNEGATLLIGGGNTVSGGEQSYSGTVAFALQGWSQASPGTQDNAMLTIGQVRTDPIIDVPLGTGGVDILDPDNNLMGLYTLVTSEVNGTVIDTAALSVNSNEDVYTSVNGGAIVGTRFFRLLSNNAKTWLQLQISDVGSLVWDKTQDSNWDIATTSNWRNASISSITGSSNPLQFVNGASVAFNPNRAGTVTVATGGVVASTMDVSTAANQDYRFTGAAITTTGALTKSGIGTLIFANSGNTFDSMAIRAGTVAVGTAAQLGTTLNKVSWGGTSGDATILLPVTTAMGTYLAQPTSVNLGNFLDEINKARTDSGLGTLQFSGNVVFDSMINSAKTDANRIVVASGKYASMHLSGNTSLTVSNTVGNDSGGAMLNSGTLLLTADDGAYYYFLNNENATGYFGAALANRGGTAYIENAIFANNGTPQTGSSVGALHNDNAGQLVLRNAVFIGNLSSSGTGTLDLNHNAQTTLVDTSFYKNLTIRGAAVSFGDSGDGRPLPLTQIVSAGKTSVYAGNASYVGNYTTAPTFRAIDFFVGGDMRFTVQTDANPDDGAGVLRMLDPMYIGVDGIPPEREDTISIRKTGGGIWQLAGNNELVNHHTVTINVAEGTLELLAAANNQTITPEYGSPFTHSWTAGSITFGSDDSLTLAQGATLKIDGGNTITGGTLDFSGSVVFVAKDWTAETGVGTLDHAMLTLTSPAAISKAVGTGGINIVDFADLRSGVYTLVSSSVNNAIAATYALSVDSNPYTAGTMINTKWLTLVEGSNKEWLQMIVMSDALEWNNSTGNNTWDVAISANWRNASYGTSDLKFYAGEPVAFYSDKAGSVTVATGGVVTSTMDVSTAANKDYRFTGAAITTTGVLTKSGAGTLTFANSGNTFDSMAIRAGTVAVGTAAQLGTTLNKVSWGGTSSDATLLSPVSTAMGAYLAQASTANLAALRTAVNNARDSGLATLQSSGNMVLDSMVNGAKTDANRIVVASGKYASMHLSGNTSLTVSNTRGDGGGGAMLNSGTLLLTADDDAHYYFLNNENASDYGAVLGNGGGSVYIENAIFANNGRPQTGSPVGAVHNDNSDNDISAQLVLRNAVFIGNLSSAGRGILDLNHNAQTTIIDTSFYKNNMAQEGAAVTFLDSANGPLPLTQIVSAGKTSVYAGNASYESGYTTASTFKAIDFFVGGDMRYTVQTEANPDDGAGVLRMLDPMDIGVGGIPPEREATVSIRKTGGGIWQLAGSNELVNHHTVTINVAEGTLELLAAANNQTITPEYGSPFTHSWTAGSITFGSDDSLTLAQGATLKIDGGNTIIGGTNSYSGTLVFSLTGATTGTARLNLSGGTPVSGSLAGANDVRLYDYSSLAAGTYLLIASDVANSVAKGTLKLGDGGTYTPSRSPTAGSMMYGLSIDSNKQQLSLNVAAANTNGTFTWTSAAGDHLWNVNAAANWSGTVNNIALTTFLNGDTVLFNTATATESITVDGGSDGYVTVNGMTVNAAHTFLGDEIRLSGTSSLSIADDVTLTLGDGGNLVNGADNGGDINGAVVLGSSTGNGSTLAVNRSGNLTLEGVISGKGILSKQGSGTLTLTAANTYTDGTRVYGGTLVGTTTSIQGAIINNATVQFSQATDGAYSGAMTGTGALAKNGAGKVSLSGAHTYSGGTTVTAGTLEITGTLDSDSIVSGYNYAGNISNTSSVVFNQSADQTLSGVISGAGALTKQGTGTLTLSGANTYSGGTTVSGGSLVGTTTSLQGAIVNNANLTFDQTSNGTYAGTLSGSGTLTKNSAGNVTLTADSTAYTGTATVNAGTLTLSGGKLGGAVTLSGGKLGVTSNGAIGGALTTNDGEVVFSLPASPNGKTLLNVGSAALGTTGTKLTVGAVNNGKIAGLAAGEAVTLMSGTSISGKGVLWLLGASSAYTAQRGASGTLIYGLTQSSSAVQLHAGSATRNTTDLKWSGAASSATSATYGIWDKAVASSSTPGTMNWSGTVDNAPVTTFLDGDSVTFDNTGTYGAPGKSISVIDSGVTVGNLTLNSSYDFIGGTITAQANSATGATGSVSMAGTAALGLVVNGQRAALNAVSMDFSGTGDFNVAGLTLTQPGVSYTVVQTTNGISGLTLISGTNQVDPAQIRVGGEDTGLDFVTVQATVSNQIGTSGVYRNLDVTSELIWNAAVDTIKNIPHGNFTLTNAGNSFTVGTALADRASGTFTPAVWDGKSLTKLGAGTLTLSGNNTYTGTTTVSAGTLVVSGLIGATTDSEGNNIGDYSAAISNAGTLTFNQDAHQTLRGAITGSGTLLKDGSGVLTLTADNSAFSGTTTVNKGILSLSGAVLGGNVTLANAGELKVDGSATINGNLAAAGKPLNFVLPDAPDGKTLLTVKGSGQLNLQLAQKIVVDGISKLNNAGDSVDLISVDNGSMNSATGTLWLAGESTAYVPQRGSGGLIYGLVREDSGAPAQPVLQLLATDSDDNAGGGSGGSRDENALQWTGDASYTAVSTYGVWDADSASSRGTANWSGTVGGIEVRTFYTGDSVSFNSEGYYQDPQEVHVASSGVHAGEIFIQGQDEDNLAAYNFTGGKITVAPNSSTGATGAVDVVNGVLGLAVGNQAALEAVSLSLDDKSRLNIAGYDLGNLGGNKTLLVDTSAGVTGFDPLRVTIGGSDQVDFLQAVATLENNEDVYVSTQLNWYAAANETGARAAHGQFTLDDANDTFTLNVALRDRSDVPGGGVFPASGWDGKSLTKKGDGTLILTGENNNTGTTRIEGGVLQIGNGGEDGSIASDVVDDSILRFHHNDLLTYAGTISGNGSLEKTGSGELTLSGSHSFSGGTQVKEGSLVLTGSLASKVDVVNAATLNLHGKVDEQVTLTQQATLNVYKGATMQHLNAGAGSSVGFYLPTNTVNGDVLAQVRGNAVLDNANVRLGIDGGYDLTQLASGDAVTLLQAGTLSTRGTQYLTASIGSTMMMDVTVAQEGNNLVANFSSGSMRIDDGAKALVEGQMSGMVMIQQAADLAAERGLTLGATCNDNCDPAHIFGVIEVGKQKVKTHSSIELRGYNVLTGLAINTTTESGGHATSGFFFEYGDADLDTFNAFAKVNVLGNGKTKYVGGGLMGRYRSAKGFYGELVARGGNIKTNFHSPSLTSNRVEARFESSTPYWGVSLATGVLYPFSDYGSLDFYGKVLFSQQTKDDVKLSTGEMLHFDAQSSTRVRAGVKLDRYLDANKQSLFYMGVAYEYQFSSELKATDNGMAIEAPELKGGTGILNVGLRYRPSAKVPVAFELGAKGYTGRRKGASGSLKVSLEF